MSKEIKKWMPMFWAEYFGKTRHLTCLQHGAYMQLIGNYWLKGKLPTDEKLLARIVGVPLHTWRTEIREAMGEFFNGDWTHDRIEAELAYAIEKSKRLSANAKLRLSNGRASAGASADTPTPTPTPTKKEVSKESSLRSDWPPGYEEEFWKAYPRKVGKLGALKALSTVRKYGIVPWEKLISAVRTYAATADPNFTKHPKTWLNQGCWDDDPAANGGANGQGRPRAFQDDSRSLTRAADRLIEKAQRGEFAFGPRPGLSAVESENVVQLLPKGRSE